MHRRGRVEQRLHDPPGLFDTVLAREAGVVADHRRMEQHLVRRRTLATLLGEPHVEAEGLRATPIGPSRVDAEPDARRRVELDHELIGLRCTVAGEPETEPGWALE